MDCSPRWVRKRLKRNASLLITKRSLYGRTSDRSVLGSQNDLASMAQYKIAYDGGLQAVDVADVNLDLNETPMSRLGMASPIPPRFRHGSKRRADSVLKAKESAGNSQEKTATGHSR